MKAVSGRGGAGRGFSFQEFADQACQDAHQFVRFGFVHDQRRQQVGGTISHTVILRYVAGVTGKMRFRWTSRAGRLLYISSVVEQGFRDELELGCEEQIT